MSSKNYSGNNARNSTDSAKSKSFESVDRVLAQTLKRFGLDNDIARYKFVLHWREIVGEHIASRTKPECINRQTLIVRVKDSAWAQELAFQKGTIIKRLQRYLGDKEIVRDVHFYVGILDQPN